MNIKKYILLIVILILILSISVYVYAVSTENVKTKFKQMNQIVNTITDEFNLKENEKTINGNEKIKYQKTKLNKDIYVASNNDEYIYKDNKLVGFIKDIDEIDLELPILDEESAEKVADKFLKENFSNFQKYEIISSNYIKSYAQYSFTYMNKLNNFNTNDIICIYINNAGNIVSYSAFKQGEFEKYKNLKIDVDTIKNSITKIIKDKYNENYVNVKFNYCFLNLINNKLVLQSDINIELKDNTEGILDTIIYELE